MKKITKRDLAQKQVVTLGGFMALGVDDKNRRELDFVCCEDVEAEAFIGKYKVQGMRDGNIYITELPKRPKNKPLFREDNSSLSHGRNGKYYFVLSIDDNLIETLPQILVNEASAIAHKIMSKLIYQK